MDRIVVQSVARRARSTILGRRIDDGDPKVRGQIRDGRAAARKRLIELTDLRMQHDGHGRHTRARHTEELPQRRQRRRGDRLGRVDRRRLVAPQQPLHRHPRLGCELDHGHERSRKWSRRRVHGPVLRFVVAVMRRGDQHDDVGVEESDRACPATPVRRPPAARRHVPDGDRAPQTGGQLLLQQGGGQRRVVVEADARHD